MPCSVLALIFSQKINVVPENILTSLLNDRLVVKGTVQEVLTIFFQVGSTSNGSSSHSSMGVIWVTGSGMELTGDVHRNGVDCKAHSSIGVAISGVAAVPAAALGRLR